MGDDNWTKFCKSEFAWIREQLTNHLPHKMNMMFWKFLGAILVFGIIAVAIIGLMK